MGTASEILSGSDKQVAQAVKKLADRAMGAGGREADAKAGRELVALFKAAEKAGDGRVVRTLAETKDLQDFILFAAEHGHAAFVEALIRAGVSPSLNSMAGLRPIVMAAIGGHADVIEVLVRAGADPSYAGFFQKPVLLHAIEKHRLEAAAALVRQGANVRARNPLSGSTPLVEAAAAAKGGTDGGSLVRLMIERGADANDPDDDGRTPLMAAAAAGNLDAVRALLEAGADVNAVARLRPVEAIDAENRGVSMFSDGFWRRMRAKGTDSRLTALMLAAGNGHAEVVEALVAARADVAAKDERGRTAADYAEANAHATVLRVLRGGPAGGPPELGVRDLLAAVEAGDAGRVDEVLEAGVDVNARPAVRYVEHGEGEVEPTGGRPALVVAASLGRVEIVEQLLRNGADVNALADATLFDNGQTALHAAAERGHAVVVRALLAAGADVKAKEKGRPNIPGRTAMQLAAEHGRKAVVEELLRAGASTGSGLGKTSSAKAAKPGQKRRPAAEKVSGLHEAAENGDETLVRRLLGAGAEADALATGTRWSPLMYAAFMGYAGAAKVLLDAGADVNLANRAGQTALSVAVHGAEMAPDVRPKSRPPRSYAKTVRLLLSRGADASVDTWDDMTPLDMAKESGLTSLVTILRQARSRRS